MPHSIRWFPWCKNTFAKAAAENKPILMYLTAHWCAWCAVMDDTTYRDPQVINMVEDNFIPMKVNIDQFPHVADRYHFGGYPSVVFLSGDGQIMKGENFLSGELMKNVLTEVLEEYQRRKKSPSFKKKKNRPGQTKVTGKLEHNTESSLSITEINRVITNAYDREYGGFIVTDREWKFPYPEIHDYLLLYTESNPGSYEEMMVKKTLQAMWAGEIYDHRRGGFFRFCEARDWTLPHAEKLLDINAALIRNYLTAYDKLGWDQYGVLIKDTINYLTLELYHDDAQLFGGSRIGKEMDPTPFTNWNSMMSSSLLLAYRVLGEKEYLERGLKVIDSLWAGRYRLGRGMSHFYLNGPVEVELLSDQVKYIEALYHAYMSTGEKTYLNRAFLLLRYIEKNYRLPEGNFSDIPLTEKNPGYLSIPLVPFIENVDVALIYIRMFHLCGLKAYLQRADEIMQSLTLMMRGNPVFSAKYGQGMLEMENSRLKNCSTN